MTSREFVTLISVPTNPSEEFDYLVSLLLKLAQEAPNVRDNVAKIIRTRAGTNEANTAHTGLGNTLDRIGTEIRTKFTIRKVWAGVEQLTERIRRFGESSVSVEIATGLQARVDRFSDAFEEFTKSYHDSEAFTLLNSAVDLLTPLESLGQTATLTENSLDPVISRTDDEQELNLVLSSTPSAIDFSTKIAAIAEMYGKLAELFSISVASNPLRLVRLEFGSMWLKAFGAEPIIKVMVGLIEAAGRYFLRTFTKEGRIVALPRNAEAIEAVLELRKTLADQGLKSEGMDEHIEKASVALAQQLSTLLAGEPRITVDAIEITIGANNADPRQLPGRSTRLLKNAEQDLSQSQGNQASDRED